MTQRETKEYDLIDKALSILQEFYIEFFGIFLPGVIAVGCVGLMLGGLYCYVVMDWGAVNAVTRQFNGDSLLPTMLLLFIAYMIGAIEYRREPKGPDAISSFRQWKRTSENEKGRLSVQFSDKSWRKFSCCKNGVRKLSLIKILKKTRTALKSSRPIFFGFWICYRHLIDKYDTAAGFLFWVFNYVGWIRDKASNLGVNIDFPYPHLKKFLSVRHLHNLSQYIAWCDSYCPRKKMETAKNTTEDKANQTSNVQNQDDATDALDIGKGSCSKHIINTIKHCVRSSGRASLISDLTRNECHIRMLCSFWYVLSFLMWVAIISLVIACGVFGYDVLGKHQDQSENMAVATNQSTVVYSNVTHGAVCVNMSVWTNTFSSSENDISCVSGQSVASELKAADVMRVCLRVDPQVQSKDERKVLQRMLAYPVALLLGFILIWYCRRNIEKGLHYVRSREVVVILESACILERLNDEVYPDLFSTAKADACRFESEYCGNCANRENCHIEEQ